MSMSQKRAADGINSNEEARDTKRRATSTQSNLGFAVQSSAGSGSGTLLEAGFSVPGLHQAPNPNILAVNALQQQMTSGFLGNHQAATNQAAVNQAAASALLDDLRRQQGAQMAAANRASGLCSSLSPEQLQRLLGNHGGIQGGVPAAAPRPASSLTGGAGSLLPSSVTSDAQALLVASRLRQVAQAQAASNFSSLLPSFPSTSASALALPSSFQASLNHAVAAAGQAAARQQTALESQIRAAQLMNALQNQATASNQHHQVDPSAARMSALLGQSQQHQPSPSLGSANPAPLENPPSSPGRLPSGSKTASSSNETGGGDNTSSHSSASNGGGPVETFLEVAGALPPAIPPAAEGSTPHYSERTDTIINMSTDEDQNWLSEFQCFIRSEILEVFRASAEDVQIRNNSKTLQTQQIGIRCRFCAHLPPSARASRSSAFPSSIPQIYQSFTMMLRDHWTACQSIPSPQKDKFMEFKTKNNQGASDSKNYWMHAARRTGMVNTPQGIDINAASRAAAARIPPFGTNGDTNASLMLEREDVAPLVLEEDKELLKDQYWFVLLQQVQRVRLSASERVGNRKSLRIGLPGFGCRYCCQAGRLGLSRIFPARRRTLPSKIPDIHDHLRRCPLCPQSVKDELQKLEKEKKQHQREEEEDDEEGKAIAYTAGKEKEFFSRIWARLGHGNKPEPS